MQNDFPGGFIGCNVAGINQNLWRLRRFIWIINAGKALNEPGPGFGIHTLAVSFLTNLERRGDKNLGKTAVAFNDFPDFSPGSCIGGDGGAYGYAAVFGYLAGDETNTPDVDIPVFPGEIQFAG